MTENLSQTGILFRTELPSREPLGGGTPVDVVLEIPPREGAVPGSRVRRRATAVRTVPAPSPEMLPAADVACETGLWESAASGVNQATIQQLSAPDRLDRAAYDDGFAWLVSLPELPIEVIPGPAPSAEIRRPRRFSARLPVRYRLPTMNIGPTASPTACLTPACCLRPISDLRRFNALVFVRGGRRGAPWSRSSSKFPRREAPPPSWSAESRP